MRVERPSLLVRADANSNIGSGHVMRCLALSQAWEEAGGEATFALADGAGTLPDRLLAEGMSVVPIADAAGTAADARRTADLAAQADWVVLDGYEFGGDYQKAVAASGTPVLVLDDYGHASHRYADILLNQNIGAHPEAYPDVRPDAIKLLGTPFAMLRREFREVDPMPPARPPHRVLVTLGGGDPENVTGTVVEALGLCETGDLEVVVLAGGNNAHQNTLARQLDTATFDARLVSSTDDMPSLIEWADLAISAGGSTCWELAYMGRPNLIVSIAANQSDIAQGLDAAGVSVHAGWYSDVSAPSIATRLTRLLSDPDALAEMSRRGQALIDGEGAPRVVAEMRSLTSKAS